MRIETFNAAATSEENAWLFETMTKEDGISHLSGLADIDVTRDEVVRIDPPIGWTGEVFGHRIIEGIVRQRLFMWHERCSYFGQEHFLGGFSIPEEDRVYLMGQCRVEYNEQTNVLRLTSISRIYE